MEELIHIKDKSFVPYISEQEIMDRVASLGAQLNQEYADKSPLMIVVLNGAFVFAADLARELTVNPEIQFIRISTYGDSMTSSKDAQLLLGLEVETEGKDVIIIEDIVETGFTVQYLIDNIRSHNPSSIKLVTLLFKPEKFEGGHKPDFVGFEIPSDFVVGYGLDYAQQGRELKALYQLKAD
ncbi:MAG: hypoxanthine phosphoribosyltransferase [Bacteroidota bacterium]